MWATYQKTSIPPPFLSVLVDCLSFPVSSLKPLSSGYETVNTHDFAPLGAVFCHFEFSQWSAPVSLSTLIYNPAQGAHPYVLWGHQFTFPANGGPG